MTRKIFYWVFLVLGILILIGAIIEFFVVVFAGSNGAFSTVVSGLLGSVIFFYIASKLKS